MVAQIRPKGIQCENMIPVIWISFVPFVHYLYHLCANQKFICTMICVFCPHKWSANVGDDCTNSTKGYTMRKYDSHYLDIVCVICPYLCNLCANQIFICTMICVFCPHKLSTNVGDGHANSTKGYTMREHDSRYLEIICAICALFVPFVR